MLARVLGYVGDLLTLFFGDKVPLNSNRIKKLLVSLTVNCDKVRDELGFCPGRTFEQGIKCEVDWYLRGKI
jgi:nucleoside-diphosphate-sugar epimerase